MKLSNQFLSFSFVGIAGLLVDIAVLYALERYLNWYGARAASFLCAATSTWLLNRRFTFQAGPPGPTSSIGKQYLAYLTAMLAGGAINYGVYVLALDQIHSPGAPAIGVALGSLAGLVVNFMLAKYAVFNSSSKAKR